MGGYLVVEIVRLVKGRTWLVSLPDGQHMEVASKNFKGVAGPGNQGTPA